MAKLIKCPRCQAKIDVTDLSAGSTVRCTDCGAMVRIPTGNTGKHPAAVPPPAAPAPAPQQKSDRPTKSRTAGAGRQTNLFRKMSGVKPPGEKRARGGGSDRGSASAKPNNTNLIVGASVGGIILIGVVAFALMGGKKDEKHGGKGESSESRETSKKKSPPASAGKLADKPASSFTAAPSVPAGTFQPGARGQVGDVNVNREVQNAGMKAQYEEMAAANKVSEIVAADGRLWLYIIDGMLSDKEAVARASMQAVHDIIVKRGFAAEVKQYTQLATAANIMNFEAASARAEEYGYWSRWWYTRSSQDMVEKWKSDSGSVSFTPSSSTPETAGAAGTPASASGGDWDEIMKGLRAGGGFDNQNSPEYPYFQEVKRRGKAAYPKLISYIDNEDPSLGRAAVAVLMALTGKETKLPNEANKTAIKAEWEALLK